MVTYILFIVSMSYGIANKAFSVSEFHSKVACELALNEAKKYGSVYKDDSKCIEIPYKKE